jgi:hypothetical protein
MRFASDLTDSSTITHSTVGSVGFGQGAAVGPGAASVDAQSLTLALVGVAGAIFLFAAYNTFSRTATVKVRKR